MFQYFVKVIGPLAQSVEHRPFKAVVGGSNPARLIITMFFVIAKKGEIF